MQVGAVHGIDIGLKSQRRRFAMFRWGENYGRQMSYRLGYDGSQGIVWGYCIKDRAESRFLENGVSRSIVGSKMLQYQLCIPQRWTERHRGI